MKLTQPQKRLLLGLSFNKIADTLLSAKTTLTAVLLSCGAPSWMLAYLVPIRESGALLPQAMFGILMRYYPHRHLVWRAGVGIQILSALSFAISFFVFTGTVLGWCTLILLCSFSIGRAMSSLATKDLTAEICDKGQRGQLIGLAATLSGVVALAIAVPMSYFSVSQQQENTDSNYLGLFLLSGVLSLIATLVSMFSLKAKIHAESKTSSLLPQKNRATVFRFIVVRGLMTNSALVAPYYLATSSGNIEKTVPLFIGAQALASLLSSFIWGKVSDFSALFTLRLSGAIAIVSMTVLVSSQMTNGIWLAVNYFVLCIAHAGVRSGRKTYSLDKETGQARTEFVAFTNTAIGFVLLMFASLYGALESTSLGFLEPVLSNTAEQFGIVLIMIVCLLLGIVMSWFLPNEKQ